MNRSSMFVCLSLCTIITVFHHANSGPVKKRSPSSYSNFKVISNSSVPCTTMLSPGPGNARKHTQSRPKIEELTPDDLNELLEAKGIRINPAYAAESMEEADRTLPNLIPLSSNLTNLIERTGDHPGLLKSDVYNFLKKMQEEHPEDEFEVHLPTDEDAYIPPFESTDSTLDGYSDTSTTRRAKRSLNPTNRIEYCIPRGTATPDGNYLRLCSTCSVTSSFDDIWPPQLSQAICNVNDMQCLYADTTNTGKQPQGMCINILLSMNVLEKHPDDCVLALKDGQTIIVNEWVEQTITVSVGCECYVNTDSIFANFV